MSSPKYTDILKYNSAYKKNGKIYNIAILSNTINTPLKDIIEYYLRIEGINAEITLGNYDNIVQDSNKFKDYNAIIIFWEIANLIHGFQYKAQLYTENELKSLIIKIKSEIDFVISNLKNTGLVLFNKFSVLAFNYQNIRLNNLDEVCSELNYYLSKNLPDNFILIDTDKIISKLSIDKSIDFRYFYLSKMLYTIEFYKSYVSFIKPIILSANGKSKKVLIFDCDNTIWKGILGEDGSENLEMSESTKDGDIFAEIQHLLLTLNKQGTLLGICSKNNETDIEEVIMTHPDIKIKNENISIKKINWNDKAENLTAIAQNLNLGLDSIVFLDDSDFEVNYIRENLPEVTVLQVPKEKYEYPGLLRKNSSLFFNLSQSDEDLNRSELYKTEEVRNKEKKVFTNPEDYLKSLKLSLSIYINEKKLIPRIAQLTQKTNQFNLTTKRYTESNIKSFFEDNNYLVLVINLTDKFGNYGITGVNIIEINVENKSAFIDTFLLSCRVIGRNIEYALMDNLIKLLSEKGIKSLKSVYIKTSKNEQVKKFYESLEFKLIKETDSRKFYELNIDDYNFKNLDYIEVKYVNGC